MLLADSRRLQQPPAAWGRVPVQGVTGCHLDPAAARDGTGRHWTPHGAAPLRLANLLLGLCPPPGDCNLIPSISGALEREVRPVPAKGVTPRGAPAAGLPTSRSPELGAPPSTARPAARIARRVGRRGKALGNTSKVVRLSPSVFLVAEVGNTSWCQDERRLVLATRKAGPATLHTYIYTTRSGRAMDRYDRHVARVPQCW
jgi:hypothetical protein